MFQKQPLSPAEFDAACRRLIDLCPFLSEGSGHRTAERNQAVNGNPRSKHLIGMARDFHALTAGDRSQAGATAGLLGLWWEIHDKGSGEHLHVQGLAPGDVPEWWLSKYGAKD